MNLTKNEILKNFTIGFIPILIFLIADLFYGAMTGIIVALVFGFGELVYFYLKTKTFEKFILFDVGLLIIFGLVSLLLENEFFFELKPAVLEFILVIVLAIHGFTSRPVLLLMGKRYMRDLTILPAQELMLKNMTRILTFVLLAHVILIVWSAWFWSKEAWAFISGGLFYIIIAIIFIGQWFYLRYFKAKIPFILSDKNEEWFDIVDETGKVLGKATRSQVHGNPSLLHATVHIHIFNKQGRLFLQKRSSNKDLYPGKWDTAVGGHVNSGENIRSALLREAMEELNVDASSAQPLMRYVMRNKHESELVHSFKLIKNGPFKLNQNEIDEGRFWTMFEIRRNLGTGCFTPNFEQEFKLLEQQRIV